MRKNNANKVAKLADKIKKLIQEDENIIEVRINKFDGGVIHTSKPLKRKKYKERCRTDLFKHLYAKGANVEFLYCELIKHDV